MTTIRESFADLEREAPMRKAVQVERACAFHIYKSSVMWKELQLLFQTRDGEFVWNENSSKKRDGEKDDDKLT